MAFDGADRREFERQPVSVQVRYRALDTFFYDYALNISHGGIFIKTTRPLSRGSDVEIEFEIPGLAGSFTTVGKVARVVLPGQDEYEPAGMGIQFAPLSPKDKQTIDDLWQASVKGVVR